jgi:hypothetical protein
MLGNKGFDVIDKMLDRAIWKSMQTTETKMSWNLTLMDWLIAIRKVEQKAEE